MFETDIDDIRVVIRHYFEGIFVGDLQKLQNVFHPQCILFGDVNGTRYIKDLSQYFTAVAGRKSPAEMGEPFKMKILSIEVLNGVAYARLHCPMLGNNYYDYLGLQKTDAQWKIVSKLFVNVPQ